MLAVVGADFAPYYTLRFCPGLRSSEIHGLTWRHIDFERRQILVYQAWVRNELIPTKTDGSYRAVGVRRTDDEIVWFFIGTHAEYDRLLRSL